VRHSSVFFKRKTESFSRTIGDLENGASQSSLVKFNELAAEIRKRSYPGLRLMTQIYSGENHGAGGVALTLINGLRQCCSAA
jgi:hypothetical protein